MAWRFHDDGFSFYETARVPFRYARTCGACLVSGSHVACCLRPGHDGPHESEDGEQWEER